jgi:DNA-binding transcriptional LysR family regulator
MELRHLRYFIAVAEALSFTKAALNLRLAQPSLTRQVRNLEDELGVHLLDRRKNRIALTEEGRVFLFDAKKLLTMCAESVATVQRMNRTENSCLNLGYNSNLHYGLLPATLGAFRKLCPGVALNLFDMTRADQFKALEARKIDLGFVGLPPACSGHDLLSLCVGLDTMLAVLPARHALADKPKLKLPDLGPHHFVGMSPTTHPGSREWLVEVCKRAGFVPKVLQEVESEPAAIKFVADGLGVTLMPEQIARLSHDGVVFRPLNATLQCDSAIAWHSENPSRPLQDYIRIVKDLSRSM